MADAGRNACACFKRFYLLFVFSLTLLLACSRSAVRNEALPAELSTQTIRVDHHERRYALFVPFTLPDTARFPLILELHGGGVYIEDMTGQSGHKTPYKLWMELAREQHLIVAYPEGLNGAYGKPTWNDCRANARVNSTADDVHFISVLIDSLAARFPLDLRRVYVCGTSNGGLMALRLAVERPRKIAAVAAIAAAMPDSSECPPPGRPLSVLFMNGTADNHLPYNGGFVSQPPNPAHGSVLSTPASVKIWTTLDHTDSIPLVVRYPDLDPKDGSTVIRYSYLHGRQNSEVVLYKIIGGGHSAPSIRERYSWLYEHYFGRQNHDIEMVREVWAFFRDKRVYRNEK